MPIVPLENVYKSFGFVKGLHGVSFSVDEGQAVALISGKALHCAELNVWKPSIQVA